MNRPEHGGEKSGSVQSWNVVVSLYNFGGVNTAFKINLRWMGVWRPVARRWNKVDLAPPLSALNNFAYRSLLPSFLIHCQQHAALSLLFDHHLSNLQQRRGAHVEKTLYASRLTLHQLEIISTS
jgi:hypothetical protein